MLKKKVVCPRSHPASRIYTHVYFVHIRIHICRDLAIWIHRALQLSRLDPWAQIRVSHEKDIEANVQLPEDYTWATAVQLLVGAGISHWIADLPSGTTVCCRVTALREQGQGRFSTHAIVLTPCAETKKELADVISAHTPGVPVSVPVTALSEPVGVARACQR